MIHPTTIVDPGAEIDATVQIGPYCVIEKDVIIGPNVIIGAHVTIDQYTTIEEGCRIFHHAAIGAAPQSMKFGGEKTTVVVCKNTVLREFVTIHRGTAFGGGKTEVGEENYIMAYSHIAHDCKTGRGVVMANNGTLAGHITIGDFATVGGLTAIHQFSRVGEYAFIGGKSAVSKDIPPYVIAAGDRAKLHGLNKVGLKRHGFSLEARDALKKTYRILFRLGLTQNEAIERIKAEVELLPEVKNFIEFMQSSTRGVTRGRGQRE